MANKIKVEFKSEAWDDFVDWQDIGSSIEIISCKGHNGNK